MTFTLLDNFYSKDICEIDMAYSLVVTKPEFKGGDSLDRLLIIILYEFSQHPELFSNDEVKLISTLIKIREAKGYIEFKRIYFILKSLILNSNKDTRSDDTTKIKILISNPERDPNYIDFSEIQSEIPMMKNVMVGICSSPICGENNERFSDFLELPIQYGVDDIY